MWRLKGWQPIQKHISSVNDVLQLSCFHCMKGNHRFSTHKHIETPKSFHYQRIKMNGLRTIHTSMKNCNVETNLPNNNNRNVAESTVWKKPESLLPQTQIHKKSVLSLDDIYELLQDVNGKDIVVLELTKQINYVDFFIVVTANSNRHLVYMSQTLNQLYKNKKSPKDPFLYIEGKNDSDNWHCIDMGHAVVHFMLQNVRDRYQLEKLWLLGPKYDELWHEVPEDPDPFSVLDSHDFKEVATEMEQQERVDLVAPWDTSFKPQPDSSLDEFDEDDYVV
uniref:Mitochondrial assembly of ribosomal large subunit protein 1 n=1 Tax=Phallusia mammillata TaxID=59560 RepID=A0A6F9DIY9_9ASCI|nr:uncharacterized protein LOC100186222 [Phallusia mammillata]